MKKSVLTLALISGVSLSVMQLANANSSPLISFENISNDVSYLASDKLKGRASFSPEIDQAADYIAQRFSDIGLNTLNNSGSFKQSFSIYNIVPKTLAVTLNEQVIDDKNVAMASTTNQFNWHKSQVGNKEVTLHVIGAEGDLRVILKELNQAGGQHVVLLNTKHAELFARYQNYFQSGLTKLDLEDQGTVVIVLTDQNQLNSMSIVGTTTISQKSLSNVVAVLPGKSKVKELVLYSSHYDHLGAKEDNISDKSDKSDLVFNGADDDASGTSAIINIAQYYAEKGDNERTLVFAAFTAEEIGGFGSRFFSEKLSPADITAMINIEMIGKPSKFGAGTVWMTGMERSNLGQLLNDKLKGTGIEIFEDPYPEQGLFYRSDNATLARLGVPAHSFSSTQLDKDQHYHQVTDDLASLDLQSMHSVIKTLAVATQGLVDGTITPSRIDTTKVTGHGRIY